MQNIYAMLKEVKTNFWIRIRIITKSVIDYFLFQSLPLPKIHHKFIHSFPSNLAYSQTNKPTNRDKNITSLAEVSFYTFLTEMEVYIREVSKFMKIFISPYHGSKQ